VLQVNPHEVPSHVAVAFAGGEQAVHEVDPQLAMLVFAAQVLPHTWYPVAQVKPHDVPSQVAVELAGGAQGVHEAPQSFTLVFVWHVPLQLCVPLGHTPEHA
jgi:hypothetical protein